MQGYSIPETTRAYGAVLPERRRRGVHRLARPARRGQRRRSSTRSQTGSGVETPGRPPGGLPRHDADLGGRRGRLAAVHAPPLPRRRASTRCTEQILTYPVLHYQNGGLVIDDATPQTTLEGLYACGEIAGGTHGRNRMMGNSLLECMRLRPARGQGRRGEGERMSIDVDTDLRHAVEDAAAHLYVWALKDIPQDLRDALADARRPRDVGPGPARAGDDPQERQGRRRPRTTSSARTPASPSTPCRVGEHFPLHPARIYEALNDRHRARDHRASAALERRAHDHAREHRPEHRLPAADRPLGVRRRTGTGST